MLDYIRLLINKILGKSPKVSLTINLKTESHGSKYGRWTLLKDSLNYNSIVYSCGIGKDVTFDLALIKKYSLNVYAFDPTPEVINWISNQKLPDEFIFSAVAINNKDTPVKFFKPINPNFVSHSALTENNEGSYIWVDSMRIQTLMKKFGHNHIDLLKLDIEGFEYEVIYDIIDSNCCIKQILVELHHTLYGIKTSKSLELINFLRSKNYHLYHISNLGFEYSFIRSDFL